jgi:hypothetical protein
MWPLIVPPEIVDLMFSDLVRPLGSDVRYIYHSIVGPMGSESGPDVDKDGVAHLALSKQTGGATFDIRAPNWQPLFESLTEEILYSQQESLLACKPQANTVEVRFNGNLVSSAQYSVLANLKKIAFEASAFEGFASGQSINIEVRYLPQAGQ